MFCKVKKINIYIYISWNVPYAHSPGVHGRFYGLDLETEMVVLENKLKSFLDYVS